MYGNYASKQSIEENQEIEIQQNQEIDLIEILPHVERDAMSKNNVYQHRGMYAGTNLGSGVKTDEGLKKALRAFFEHEGVEKIADYGARTGGYAKYFAEKGLSVRCFDGNPAVQEISGGACEELDLSQKFKMEVFDWVMSLEVGEHIPAKFEEVFLDNLDRHNKHGIILSWAVEGQAGRDHVNTHNNDYIKEKMKSM